MSNTADDNSHNQGRSNRAVVISALGVTQIFAWGTSYYLPAVLAAPIAADTGWSLIWVVGGLSLGLLLAGFISPYVGRAIATWGGRPVLAWSACILAVGLGAVGLAHSLLEFLVAWLVVGLGMGAGLYDPAFATLGRLYGQGGRSAITTLTLFGGFASTVCWPLSAFLDARFGWRGVCLAYAGFQIAVALPIYLFLIPREPRRSTSHPSLTASRAPEVNAEVSPSAAIFPLLAATITLASVISTAVSVHLLMILQAKGFGFAASVGLGALVGPSQVVARIIEMLIAKFHHPIWTKVAATSLVATGLAVLWFGGSLVTLGLAFYGAGIGLESIACGTLPLAIFGQERYPIMMGRIAMPSLIAQALAPTLGALLLKTAAPNLALGVFFAIAICNAVMVIRLSLILRATRPF